MVLAWILKRHGHEALAVGVDVVTPSTLRMLCEWADAILLTDRAFADRIPEAYRAKLRDYHVGPDIWFRHYNSDLVAKFEALLKEDTGRKQ